MKVIARKLALAAAAFGVAVLGLQAAHAQFTSPTCVPPNCSPAVIQNIPLAGTTQTAGINITGDAKLGATLQVGAGAPVISSAAQNLIYGNVGVGSSAGGLMLLQKGAVDFMRITLAGQQQLPSGTLALPSYSFLGDANTGIYQSAADTINFVTAGVSRLLVDAAGGVTVPGTLSVTGSFSAASFTGVGSSLTSLNAANIASGLLNDARLSANVALLAGTQTFTGAKTFSSASNAFTGTYSGSGAGLTSLNAANLSSGSLPDARLSANVPLLSAANTFTANTSLSGMSTFGSAGLAVGAAQNLLYGNIDTASAGSLLLLQNESVDRFRVDAAGNVTVAGNMTVAGQSVCRANGTNCPATVTILGTPNYVTKFNGTGNTVGNSQIFDNGTNVGIGTATPGASLDVKGTGVMMLGDAFYANSNLDVANGYQRYSLGYGIYWSRANGNYTVADPTYNQSSFSDENGNFTWTLHSGALSNPQTYAQWHTNDRMKLDSGGNLSLATGGIKAAGRIDSISDSGFEGFVTSDVAGNNYFQATPAQVQLTAFGASKWLLDGQGRSWQTGMSNLNGGATIGTGTLLTLTPSTLASIPVGSNGAMYYDSGTNKFMCYSVGAWSNCSGAAISGTVNSVPKFTGTGATFGNSQIQDDGTTVTDTGNLAVNGNMTLGNAAVDVVTSNAAAWSFPNVTTVALPNLANAMNFDANTLTIDALNNRVGIGTAAPAAQFEASNASGVEAIRGTSSSGAGPAIHGIGFTGVLGAGTTGVSGVGQTASGGSGVYGSFDPTSAPTGFGQGVTGFVKSPAYGSGVLGFASANSNLPSLLTRQNGPNGVYGATDLANGAGVAADVRGGANTGVSSNLGSYTGGSPTYGVFSSNSSTATAGNFAVYGSTLGSNSGTNYGGYFSANSGSTNYGVYGGTASAGGTGVYGISVQGAGVSGSGSSYGVVGSGGIGVSGTGGSWGGQFMTVGGCQYSTVASLASANMGINASSICGSNASNYAGYFQTSGGTSNNYGVYSSVSGPGAFSFYGTGGSAYFSGPVGIGTNAPSETLHVSGRERVTGELGVNGSLPVYGWGITSSGPSYAGVFYGGTYGVYATGSSYAYYGSGRAYVSGSVQTDGDVIANYNFWGADQGWYGCGSNGAYCTCPNGSFVGEIYHGSNSSYQWWDLQVHCYKL